MEGGRGWKEGGDGKEGGEVHAGRQEREERKVGRPRRVERGMYSMSTALECNWSLSGKSHMMLEVTSSVSSAPLSRIESPVAMAAALPKSCMAAAILCLANRCANSDIPSASWLSVSLDDAMLDNGAAKLVSVCQVRARVMERWVDSVRDIIGIKGRT